MGDQKQEGLIEGQGSCIAVPSILKEAEKESQQPEVHTQTLRFPQCSFLTRKIVQTTLG